MIRALRIARRRRRRMQRENQTHRLEASQQPQHVGSPTHRWCRDRDMTGLVLLARRLQEHHAASGEMMQLTAGWNQFGGAAEALLGRFLRSAAQALPTSSWLERRRRDRAAARVAAGAGLEGAAATAAGGGGISLPAVGGWQSSGELSTVQSNVWRAPTAARHNSRGSNDSPAV